MTCPFAALTMSDLQQCLRAVCSEVVGTGNDLLPKVARTAADHKGGACCQVASESRNVVDVMVSEDQVSDGLSRIFDFGLFDDPPRITVHVGRIDDDQIRAHLHNQRMMNAALHLRDARRPLDQLQSCRVGIVRKILHIIVRSDHLASQDPQIRHVGLGGLSGRGG